MLTQNALKATFRYDEETGFLYWKVKPSPRIKVGDLVAPTASGRLYTKFEGKIYQQSRLIWVMTYGVWPDNVVDHKDRDEQNNKLDNLRDVTQRVNCLNRRSNIFPPKF